MSAKKKAKHNQCVALISLWIKMEWHIKSVKLEKKVTIDENFQRKEHNNNNNKTKEQNLKETCGKSE